MTERSPAFRPSSSHRGPTEQKVVEVTIENKSSLAGTSANLVNAIVGCGIVGIPFAIRQSGFVAGVLLILFVTLVTEKSLRLLVDTAKHVHVPTYEKLAEACFGVTGFRFIAINMFLSAYGAMISYLMLVKDCFGSLLLGNAEEFEEGVVVAEDSVMMRRTILIVISLVVILPLACKRDMADLAQTSRLNVLIDLTLVALVAYNAPIREAAAKAAVAEHPASMWIHGDTIFVGLGVLSFAFVCQHSAFIIAGSLENPTSKRWGKVTSGALSVVGVLAMVCGVMGYLGYREETQGNVLENLDKASITANIARGLVGTTMLFVYPLQSFVARHVCVVLLFVGREAHEGDAAHILARGDRRVALTSALYILAAVPAALADDLGPVLALSGAVAGSCLSYIGPGAVYLGVHGERFLQLARESFGSDNKRVNTTEIQGDPTVDDGIVLVSGGTLAAETTPLVAGATITSNGSTREFDFGNHVDEGIVIVEGFWNHIVWYSLGMPIWCSIARLGEDRLKQHINELTMKSPHPIRVGDVYYKSVLVHRAGTDDPEYELEKTMQERSHPQPRNHEDGGSATNRGFNIYEELSETRNSAAESDPRKESPAWLDFCIAICYILLGLVALFAGIYSIVI